MEVEIRSSRYPAYNSSHPIGIIGILLQAKRVFNRFIFKEGLRMGRFLLENTSEPRPLLGKIEARRMCRYRDHPSQDCVPEIM